MEESIDAKPDWRLIPETGHGGRAHLRHTRAPRSRPSAAALLPLLAPSGFIWVSWPKKASKVPTDITEDTIRDVCLPMGLVDVKVCAVDAIWSGLKLMKRKAQ